MLRGAEAAPATTADEELGVPPPDSTTVEGETPAWALPRMPQRYTNAIGHPVQSRGLSPRDRTPWGTLIITGAACLLLGKAFLSLQATYEREMLEGLA